MSESLGKSDQVNPNNWEQTYREVYEQAVRLAARRSPYEERYDAEDRVQDTALSMLRQRRDTEGIEDPKNYFLKSVNNGCIDRGNRKSRLTAENSFSVDDLTNDEDERPIKELVDPRRNPEMQAQFNEENERRRRMLKIVCRDLSEREKALLALHLQGFSNDEIADRSGEDINAIRHDMNAVMAKIRYRLRRLLENDQPPST